jgi:hypothetical protein
MSGGRLKLFSERLVEGMRCACSCVKMSETADIYVP